MIYKYFLSIYFITISFFLVYFYYDNLNIRQNYLYLGQSSLEKHEISYVDPSANKIIFLGSSAVAGSNIPQHTTSVDFFNKFLKNYYAYNLAALECSSLESLILLKLTEERQPQIVVMGLNPGSFPSHLPGGNLLWNNFSLLTDFLTSYEKAAIEKDKAIKSDLFQKFGIGMSKILPTQHHINIQTFLFDLRFKIFGNVFNTNLLGKNGQSSVSAFNTNTMYYRAIAYIKELSVKKNFKFYIYLEPIYKANEVYGEQDFATYIKTVKEYLKQFNVEFFDYTNLNPSTHDFFYDFIHMTPQGNERVAKQLYQDLGGNL